MECHPLQMGLCSLLRLHQSIEMSSCPLDYTAAAPAAAVVVVTISDSVALLLLLDVDYLDIDTAHVVVVVADDDDEGRIAAADAEMADSVVVVEVVVVGSAVDYYLLYRDIDVVDRTQEVLEVDRSNHLQRLEPMLHNFDRTEFVVVAVFVVVAAGWN